METKDSIKQLRRQLNMSQKEFAAALSVTRQAVSRWECGEVVPSTDTLKLISDTFGVPVDYLLARRHLCARAAEQRSRASAIGARSPTEAPPRTTARFAIKTAGSRRT